MANEEDLSSEMDAAGLVTGSGIDDGNGTVRRSEGGWDDVDGKRYLAAVMNEDICNMTDADGCNGPHMFDTNPLTVFIYGYVSPPLVLVTLITNCLVCIVLLTKSARSPTNVLLVAMAVSDTLTGIWPIPFLSSSTRLGDTRLDPIQVVLRLLLPHRVPADRIPHGLHLADGGARCPALHLHLPSDCRQEALYRSRTPSSVIVGVYATSLASQLCRFVEYDFYRIEVKSRTVPGTDVDRVLEVFGYAGQRRTSISNCTTGRASYSSISCPARRSSY